MAHSGFSTYSALALIAFSSAVSPAQTMHVLVNNDTTSASSSAPLTAGPDGILYGTTSQGRTYGTLFRMTRAGALTTLHTFTGTDGSVPLGGVVVGTDGLLYGTTSQGGANGLGTIYKSSTTGTFTTLYSFTGDSDGSRPYGKLLLAKDGHFYGTTFQGASGGCGAIYKIAADATFTSLHQFNCGVEGGNPRDGLIQASDGYLYGTTSASGANRLGTAFKMDLEGNLTVLHTFSSTEGNTPYAGLIQGSDGNFYGTTWQGGSTGSGTIFRMNASGTITTLHHFLGSEGKNPAAPLIQGSDGNFYGSAYRGGDAIYGTLFTLTSGGKMTRLHSFKGSDGQYPSAALLENPAGTFFGTTYQGGFNNRGTVFSLTYSAPAPAPTINAQGIVPLYSTATAIQPGSWISIFGRNLSTKTATWNGEFPRKLGGTSVTINGQAAYLWYVSPEQINLQAPDDVTTGSAPVVVTSESGTTLATVTLAPASPSFLLLDSKHVTAIILRQNGSGAHGGGAYDIVGPTGSSLGYRTVAARAGDTVVLFGTGFGPVNPNVLAGEAFSGVATTRYPVTVTLGEVEVIPAFAGMSSAGLYQLNLVLPAGLGVGEVPISAKVLGVATSPGVVISVE